MINEQDLMPDLDREKIFAEARSFDPLSSLEEFTNRHKAAIEILRIGGVHPTEVSEMDNPYTGKPHSESFANIGEHCLAVASLSSTLAFKIYDKGILSTLEVDQIINRALIHDASKRFEIMRRHAFEEGLAEEVYTPKAYENIKLILETRGIDSELVDYMVDAGKETGELGLQLLLMLRYGIPGLVPDRLVEKIVYLADSMTSTSIPNPGEKPLTVFLTAWERIIASDFHNRYPRVWKAGLAFDTNDRVIAVEDIKLNDSTLRWCRNYAFWVPYVSNEICKEIQLVIDPRNTQRPEFFIKELINNELIH